MTVSVVNHILASKKAQIHSYIPLVTEKKFGFSVIIFAYRCRMNRTSRQTARTRGIANQAKCVAESEVFSKFDGART